VAEGDYYLLLILLFGVFLGLGFDLLHFLSKRKGPDFCSSSYLSFIYLLFYFLASMMGGGGLVGLWCPRLEKSFCILPCLKFN
jgi:hypothetical protein